MNYTSLIVDDERPARALIHQFLTDYVPQITAIYEADSVKQAIEMLNTHAINIVFLDIHMPNASGFELIKFLSGKDQQVVFVTAFSNYTYKAIKASAVDYLMKPVIIEELIEAVNKTIVRIEQARLAKLQGDNSHFIQLLENLVPKASKTISIHHTNGFDIVDVKDIVYLEASKSYTVFHLVNQKVIIASRNIAYFEEMLEDSIFFRLHKSYIINWNWLKGYSTIDGNMAIMENGTALPVSKRKLAEFLKLSKA